MGGTDMQVRALLYLGWVLYYIRLCALLYLVVCITVVRALLYCNFLKEVRLGALLYKVACATFLRAIVNCDLVSLPIKQSSQICMIMYP